MTIRTTEFAPGEIYHVFTRGVEQRAIFLDGQDRRRLFLLLTYCLPKDTVQSLSTFLRLQRGKDDAQELTRKIVKPDEGLVELLCYCFMPNHIHLLVQENVERGVSRYLQRLLNSYARYFNTRHQRSGTLFGSRFHAARVATTEQLLHVSRYIHLNPFVAGLVHDPLAYPWSSLEDYVGTRTEAGKFICATGLILGVIPRDAYRAFILDHAGFARDMARAQKEVLIDSQEQVE